MAHAKPKKSKSKQSVLEKEDRVFRALANRDRRAILDFVSRESKTTSQFCELLTELDRCTVMLHLRVLEKANLLIVKKMGRNKHHYLNAVPIQDMYERWILHIAQPAAKLLHAFAKEMD